MNSYFIENFITEEQENKIEQLTIDPNFPWFYMPATIVDVESGIESNTVHQKGINPFQFVHLLDLNAKENFFPRKANFIDVITPVLNHLAIEVNSNIRVLRCKFNFLPKNTDPSYHYPHVDVSDEDVITAIYYVNDSDGDTYFFDNELNITKKITPKKGRMVLFNSNKFHSSSSPIHNEYRIVINIVFKKLSEQT